MSTLLLERQQCLDDIFESEGDRFTAVASRSNKTGAHGRLTLDDLITSVWEGLALRDTVRCPACGGTMASRSAPWAADGDGACLDCGSHLV